MESLRILWILLYKCWLVRKRHWLGTLLVEILIPIGLILCPWGLLGNAFEAPVVVNSDTHYQKYSLRQLLQVFGDSIKLAYTPNNTFVNQLMMEVNRCSEDRFGIKGYQSEADAVNDTVKALGFNGVVVIFDESTDFSTKQLRYTYRSFRLLSGDLYNKYENMTYFNYISNRPLAQLQICLDKSFVKAKSDKTISEMYVQRMPYPAHVLPNPIEDSFRLMYVIFLVVALMFPLFVETARATNEKFVGMNVLMSMNGISNSSNLLSWIVSGLVLLTVFCVIPTVALLISSSGEGMPFVKYGNPLILFLTLFLYVVDMLAFGMHLSAYFTKAILVTFVIMALSIVPIVLAIFVFKENNLYLAPYAGIVFPNILLYQAVQEIRDYEGTARGVQWSNLFASANPATGCAGYMGIILLFFAIGAALHFGLAIYVYAIKPGKFGVGRHPFFFFFETYQRKGQADQRAEDLAYGYLDGTFERTRETAYSPGIQIRNLKKAYNIGLFGQQKVDALRGVSVDFYKGQITSLLGHNGAGKTTMMSIMTGMIGPTDGLVLVNGKNLKDNASEIMNDMGLCPQVDMYFASLTVAEQMTFFAMVKRKDKTRSEIWHDVQNLLLRLRLFDKKNALPSTLSGGQKRRLCLGMALIGDSSTLILDEPTSGLDPESKRVIWDILLKMKGEKTIVISTHDMEEADILGDKIAIMHAGQLRSYGSSLFLKKMIGQNNVEVTLSIEPESDPKRICWELHPEGIITSQEASKMVVSIPNSPSLPDSLDNLEEKKKSLGVSGFSVSLISLEQVFIKMTQEHDGPTKPRQVIASNEIKLTGIAMHVQSIRALFAKKLTYALKDYSTIMIKIFTVIVAILIISVVLKASTLLRDTWEEEIRMTLGKYHNPIVLYTTYDKTIGDHFENIGKNDGGDVIKISETSLDNELLNRAKKDINSYDNYILAGAEFINTTNGSIANAFYSEKATLSLLISINLVWNTIIRSMLGSEYSITVSAQNLPIENGFSAIYTYVYGFGTAIILALFLYYVVAMFIIHPTREAYTGIKQLQKMTGISGLAYWGTMFLFDMIVFVFLAVITIIGFILVDSSLGLKLYGSHEIGIMLLLFVLFAINALPLIYIFSFVKTKAYTIVRLLSYLPLGIVAFDLMMFLVAYLFEYDNTTQILRLFQKRIFLLLPHESFLHTQIILQMVAQINARCKLLPNQFYDTRPVYDVCWNMRCYNGTCKHYKNFFDHSELSISSIDSIVYLCVMPIIFFGILALLENGLIQAIKAKFTRHFTMEFSADEQVQREKLMIAQKIIDLQGSRNSNSEDSSNSDRVFMVYELRKSYGNLRAVKDVSFSVNRRECFGLLGVNGAGKSTTFRMLTGEKVPDHGEMYMRDKSFVNNKKYFLSQMGYCPQHDAILKCLNSYDHLRLFARLRGIPEDRVENEVDAWIEKLNLTACASQPSATYSGGNKRRLNIAIALIGSPDLILMDEPTTGIDPGARRSLWNVIKSCQTAGQAVVLTSPSMEECEVLCNRLAIMVDGKLVCIGPSEQLKQRFGAGYDIQIKLNLEKAKTQLDSIKSGIPRVLNCVLTDENLGNLTYHVAPTGTTWRLMYNAMNEMKRKYDCLDDFLVLSSSLEQLFLLFARTKQPTAI
ncbi:retinal-specific phospholipid-transporting ATPase ABCA4-like [Phymastichus coffea]|uniref:retinal-specific phospholipid-transporting ATPase ABCA4-like n=1 Tax=Phymastichus coffea TaxID=108790 RepID=UPI00273C2653|nr:retinal-specific phospholipid-transporting ATPase ABCA4-like [Phymastichus coffea]